MLQDNALCTVENVTDAIDTDLDEEVIERYINAASDLIESYCRRKFHAADDIEEWHGAGTRVILDRPPIRSFVNSDTYHVASASAGVLAKGCCPSPSKQVKFVYDGGFEVIPAAIVQACIDMVVARITSGSLDVMGVTSVKEGNVTATRQLTPSGLLPSVEQALKAYRLART